MIDPLESYPYRPAPSSLAILYRRRRLFAGIVYQDCQADCRLRPSVAWQVAKIIHLGWRRKH